MMQLPLTLPLNNYSKRRVRLDYKPGDHVYPVVLQIEILSKAEAAALFDWMMDQGNVRRQQNPIEAAE